MKKILSLLVAVFAVFFISSCSKSDDNNPTSGEYTVRLIGSDGVEISAIAVVIDGETKTFSTLSVNSWTSPEAYKPTHTLAVSVSAKGIDANSTLKAQILQGDKVIKESTAQGIALVTTVSI